MNKGKKILTSMVFIAIVAIVGLWDVDFSDGYLMVSELKSNPEDYVGGKVNTMGSIKNDTLDKTPKSTSFILKDAENRSYQIYIEYTGDLPANLAEGKRISLSGTMINDKKIKANKIVMGCPSKYEEKTSS
ncbi:cytochrome c maturation protein CcmE [Methanohalobium sp.]|uniref:cytochrome c maturation protein CcmE domain-containing protein n=1 Tax=Methanohalobium sp. TaxID=2837493 RepID=UPI0025CBA3BB|nr:cytochrome c maturation protein CcmE [Methanohalobium sp.]